MNDSIEAAFWLGWEAAKDPASWIFKEGKPQAGLSDADPAYVFWERMGSFELDDAESTNKELNAAVLELITEAPEKAFSLGWAAQSDPEFLIFGSKAK